MSTTVYKLGGSLLTLPDLATRLRKLFAGSSDTRPLLVVGGGSAADLVRDWDEVHQLGDERAHWLALEAMSFNEALLSELLKESCRVVDHRQAVDAWESARVPILRAAEFLRREETQHGPSLPHNWNVTSDSVAAWVAERFAADELVLLKSVTAPVESESPTPGVQSLDVDAYFHHLAAALPRLGWINLRAERPTLVRVPLR